ncbi:MAG: hypothetical protein AAB455_01480 [Patescibacteria group bacterium]
MSHNQDQQPISEKVLERIEAEKAVPTPRFYFRARNLAMWSLAAAALIFGALACSTIIFRLHNLGRIFPPRASQLEDFYDFLTAAPLLWFATFIIFGYLAYREVRQTKRGYKYELSTLLLTMVVASGVLGAIFYNLGSGYLIDRLAADHLPFQRGVEMLQRERWFNPEHGFLMGEVAEKREKDFLLSDPRGNVWFVTYATTTAAGEKELVVVARRVGLLGRILNEQTRTFEVEQIRPIEVRGQGLFPHRMMMKGIF